MQICYLVYQDIYGKDRSYGLASLFVNTDVDSILEYPSNLLWQILCLFKKNGKLKASTRFLN